MTTGPSVFRRGLQGLLCGVFAALLVLPQVQRITGWPVDKRLSGFAPRARVFPEWTARAWRRGEFAAGADAWIRDNIGLRGFFIGLNRQIRYSLFGSVETAPLRKRALVIGRNSVLFENILLIDALRPPQLTAEQLDFYVSHLARTQKLLREQGMAFMVVLAPNKAFLYPKDLPAWAGKRISVENTDYLAFIEALKRYQVPHLDTMALFRELGPQHDDMVPPHGIHWSHHGAWIAWQNAIPVLNRQNLLPDIPVPETVELLYDKPSAMNDELRAQLNLFFADHLKAVPSAYPVAGPLPPGTEPMLDVLVVGDSFGFTFIDALARSRLCRSIHYWFYMKTGRMAKHPAFDSRNRRGMPHFRKLGNLARNEKNAHLMLDGKNLVILTITTFNIDKFSWGFDSLVNHLYGDPADNQEPLPEVEVNLGD